MSSAWLTAQAWAWLDRELDRWREADMNALFWWRDDDAVGASTKLETLLATSARHDLPLALAVIPAKLEKSLAEILHNQQRVSVLQHGYAHVSHAAAGERKLEIGGQRTGAQTLDELKRGYSILAEAFGDTFIPVLVPPWNRFDSALLTSLSGAGLDGLSTMKARRARYPAPGLLQANCHLDPVAWRQDGGFIGVYPAVAILVQHLVARRLGYRERDEPTGILTHHLVQNPATWRFVDILFQRLREHPAATFVGAAEIWKRSRD